MRQQTGIGFLAAVPRVTTRKSRRATEVIHCSSSTSRRVLFEDRVSEVVRHQQHAPTQWHGLFVK